MKNLEDAVLALLNFVADKHPEIKEAGAFSCPYFQAVAEASGYWEKDDEIN